MWRRFFEVGLFLLVLFVAGIALASEFPGSEKDLPGLVRLFIHPLALGMVVMGSFLLYKKKR